MELPKASQAQTKKKFTSDAFPPDADDKFLENNRLLAEIHEILKDLDHQQLKELVRTPGALKFSTQINEDFIDQLDDLHKECFPVEYGEVFFNYIREGELRVFSTTATFPGGRTFIVGFIVYKLKDLDTSSFSYWKQTKMLFQSQKYSAHIYTLGVTNEFRGTGLAQTMFDHFVQHDCRHNQIKHLFLDCASYNKSAIKFYEKSGFIAVRRRPNYYNIFGRDYDSIQLGMYLDDFQEHNKHLGKGFDL